MGRYRLTMLLGLLLLGGAVADLRAAAPPAVGQALPDFTLAAPREAAQRAYLGLSGAGPFRVSEIKAPAVLIEILSMYCPYCQKEAPRMNRLYERIEADPALKGKVKILGIAVGNSAFEAELFRKKYQVPFPLFPDGEFTLHRLLGEVRTPFFIVVRNGDDGSSRVVLTRLGAFSGEEPFLAELLRAAGLP